MVHTLNSRENRKRGALKTKETKAGKNNRSLKKLPYPILSGFVLSRKRWSRVIPKEWKLVGGSSESMQRVTTVVSGRSVKCNAIFCCCWSVLPAVWILHISNIWEHHVKVRTTNTHNIVLYAKIWLPGRKKFWICALPFDNVQLAGVDSLNLPFPC